MKCAVTQSVGGQPPPGLGSRPASGGGPSPGKAPGQSLAQALLDTGITTAHAIDGERMMSVRSRVADKGTTTGIPFRCFLLKAYRSARRAGRRLLLCHRKVAQLARRLVF